MGDRLLALNRKQQANPSAIGSSIMAVNKGAELATKYAPNFTKKGLTSVKRAGEYGVNKVLDSKIGRFAADKVGELSSIIRTGKVLSFNAGSPSSSSGIGGLTTSAKASSTSKAMILLIGLLFFIMFLWGFNKMNLDDGPDKGKNCEIINDIYTKFPTISNINPDNEIYKYKLRDYYIKTAYNCCAAGRYKNDFVNVCALKNCIKQGARCLDFEIYSINNAPVIAVSSVSDVNIKESYNYIPFAQAMQIVSIYAFSGGNCPNPNDPLILHFRIMSKKKEVYDSIASALYSTLEDKMLGKQFSYENNSTNLGGYQLSKLMGKVVIIVDKTNPLFTSSLLNEYVNIASNSAFIHLLRYKDVEYAPDKDDLIFYNKQNMSIVIPNLSGNNKNYSSALAMSYGCQMIAMSFQSFDENMQYYTQFFDSVGSAFSLRPERFLYTPTFIPEPPVAPVSNSFATVTTNPFGSNGPSALNMNLVPPS